MREERLADLLGQVDEKYIEEAAPRKEQKKPGKKIWQRWLAMVACLCACVAVVWFGLSREMEQRQNSSILVTEEGIVISKMEVSLSEKHGEASDMIGFFIYEGRVYVHYERYTKEESAGWMGEYLGTSVGMIDEWTPKSGYVDFAGSMRGDFYSVKGAAPEFMLCLDEGNGNVSTCINNNGLTLKYGEDIFEKYLHLADQYVSVDAQTREDWYYSTGRQVTLGEDCADTILRFVETLNKAPFMRSQDIPLEEGMVSIYDDLERYHLFFRMENGMTVHLRLLEGGYVIFSGIHSVCVQMDAEVFDEMMAVLETNMG